MSAEHSNIKKEPAPQQSSVNLKLVKPNQSGAKKIWALGGGKGGVGKSLITSSLGICLARQGKSVIIVDLDLGGANLHTCLGCPPPANCLTDFLKGRVDSLNALIAPTEVKNLSFVSGANDALDIANLEGAQKSALIQAIRDLPADFVLLDLGAGTSSNTLDFFLMADHAVISVLPEPTSIENAYRFIKSAFYRKMKSLEDELGIKKVLDEAMDHKNKLGIRTPFDLINYVANENAGAGTVFKQQMSQFRLNLIVNQVRSSSDIEMGNSVRSVCQKYFGITTHYVGYLDYDNAAWQALRKRRPVILEYPYSHLVAQFQKITRALIEAETDLANVI